MQPSPSPGLMGHTADANQNQYMRYIFSLLLVFRDVEIFQIRIPCY